MRERSFVPLFITNFFGVLNDNFLKTLASLVVIDWIEDPAMKSVMMGIAAGALVLPFILCSPLADRLTAVFPKRRVLQIAKGAELPIMGVAILGFACHSAGVVIAAVLLMGLQSALYSPSKYALVRDIGGEARLSVGMGWMDGISFLGMLVGTIAAAVLVERGEPRLHYACFIAFAVLGLASSYTIRAEEQVNRSLHSIEPLRYVARAFRMAQRYAGLNAVILTLSVFWFAAAMLQMGLLVYGRQVMGLDHAQTGLMLCVAASGIVLGQITAGLIDRRRSLLGATLATGFIGAALLAVAFAVAMGPTAFAFLLGALAFDMGLFKLPFDVEIQKVVKGPRLNTMLAYFNQVSFFFMLLASLVYALVSYLFGPRAFLLVLALVFVVAPLWFALSYRPVLMFVGRWVFARRYRVETEGLDRLDATKTYLVLPNHPAMVDPMLVGTALGRIPLKPLADELFFRTGFLAPKILKTLGAVAVPDLRTHRSERGATIARGLADLVLTTLGAGGSVIFYPSGHIQTACDKEEIGTRQLAYNVCRQLPDGVEVLGVRTRGLWGSIWSRKGRKASPAFIPTFIKSVLLWFFVSPFVPKRRVSMCVENLTARTKEWAKLSRLEFNRQLEMWYNSQKEGENWDKRSDLPSQFLGQEV